MATRREIEERCLEVQYLKISGLKVTEIALVYGVSERTIWNYLKRAQKLCRSRARSLQHEEILGEIALNLKEILTQAWRHFHLCPEENAVKVGYLNTTLKAVERIMQLYQGVGVLAKAPDHLVLEEGLPFGDQEVRQDYLALLKGVLDTDAAYRLAWLIYRRKYQDRLPWYVAPEDLIQEGVLRLLEMAGHPWFQEKGFQFYLALNGMKGFIERQRRLRGGVDDTTGGYEESWRPDAWSSWQRAWQASRDGGPLKGTERSRPCSRSSTASTETVRRVYQAGGGVSQAGLGRRPAGSARGAGRKGTQTISPGAAENEGGTSGTQGQLIRLSSRKRALIEAAA